MAVTIQLKDFTVKSSPVPADIVYLGDSASSFDEVQSTIAEVIGAYPALVSIGSLTTVANEIIYTTGANAYATSAVTAFGLSVIALAAGVTTPTAGDFSTWDAHANLSANNFLGGFQAIATAATVTTLTVSSPYTTEFTGSTTQTVLMPVVSTLAVGTPYCIINNSSGVVTVESSGTNSIQAMAAGSVLMLQSILNSGTSAASWQILNYTEGFTSAAVLLSPSGDQTIASHNLILASGNFVSPAGYFFSGSATGGVQGAYTAYSPTSAMGSIAFRASDNGGNYANVITNTSTSAARTWSFPDATGTIALTSTNGGLTPNSVSGTTVSMAGGNAYFLNNAAATTATLPASGSSTIGDVIKVKGASSAAFIIQANTGQTITDGATSSSVAGTATSNAGTDSIQMVYVASNTWSVDWQLSSGFVLA